MSVPAPTFLILLLALLTGANLSPAPQSPESKKRLSEYEKECGQLVESMTWASISGKAIKVVGGNAIVVLLANDERKHVSLAGVEDARTLAAHALLHGLVLNREVTVFTNPNNIAAKEVSGVVHAQARDVNRALIEAGVTKYQEPPTNAMSNSTACVYRMAEKQAREAWRGLWAEENRYPDFAAPDTKFFKDKLGEPAHVYRHKSGVSVEVAYDAKGQACSIYITDPTIRGIGTHRFDRLRAVADELMPQSARGSLLGETKDIGNCISVESREYERVFLTMNHDFCYDQWIRFLFKRPSCPNPRKDPGSTTWK